MNLGGYEGEEFTHVCLVTSFVAKDTSKGRALHKGHDSLPQ